MISEDFENLDKALGSEYNDFKALAKEKLLGSKLKVLACLAVDGNQDTEDSEEEKSATPGELLAAVMMPEQLEGLSAIKDNIFSMLTEEQKRLADDGKNLFLIIDELDPDKKQQIEQMAQGIYESLSSQQIKDLIFMGSSYIFAGETIDSRLAILQWMKDNQKEK